MGMDTMTVRGWRMELLDWDYTMIAELSASWKVRQNGDVAA